MAERKRAVKQRRREKKNVPQGHVHIQATQIYLSMTPELLQEANLRFERYAGKEAIDD